MVRYELIDTVHSHNILPRNRELFLVDTENDDGTYISMHTAQEFIKNLRILESINHKRITVHQLTHGGSWDAGLAIFDAIVHSPCEFTFICSGLACSLGAIIPQACTRKEDSYRFSYPSCCWMIHEIAVEFGDMTNQKQQRSLAGYRDNAMDIMYNIFTHSAFSTGELYQNMDSLEIKEDIAKHMNNKQDWYLNAGEAQLRGFIDYVIGTKEATEKLEELACE